MPAARKATEAEIATFCGDCHAIPQPESFPRNRWHEGVRMGYESYARSGRSDLDPPPIHQTVDCYRSRAPEHLAFSDGSAVDAQLRSSFRLEKLDWGRENYILPAVSYLHWGPLAPGERPLSDEEWEASWRPREENNEGPSASARQTDRQAKRRIETTRADSAAQRRKRRWLQYNLRTLLIAILLLGLPVAWFATNNKGPTYYEALEAYNTERQDLERLQNERARMEEQFEAAKAKLRAIETEWRRVGKEDYQRLMEIDPGQALEYLEQRQTRDAEVAREVREGIDKLAAQHAENMQ